jgi:hypothetical protein
MGDGFVLQGRQFSPQDLALIRTLIASQPEWTRTRLSKQLCELWEWRTTSGRLKDMACRSALRKLDADGLITLPEGKRPGRKRGWKRVIADFEVDQSPIEMSLRELGPLRIQWIENGREKALFDQLLVRYHYLSFTTTVGESAQYLVWNQEDRPLGCVLFGSAAWRVACRDTYLGWQPASDGVGLSYIVNNMRFLILPWVRVAHLASHLLSRISRRISQDWQRKYGHEIFLLETFVDRSRFKGTCYQAANWICLGQTKGRSRNDRYTNMKVPIKDVYIYPLCRHSKKALCALTKG